MKRLISMLLVLTMVLTLLGGTTISAFASEEVGGESAVTDTDADADDVDDADADGADVDGADVDGADVDGADVDGADADGADVDDADADGADADGADADGAEGSEPVCICTVLCDGSINLDCPVCSTEEDALYYCDGESEEDESASVMLVDAGGTTWQKASGFVEGQDYIIVVDGTAIGTDGTNITTTTYDESKTPDDSAYIWTASSGFGLTNSDSGVNLYQTASAITVTTSSGKNKWSYTEDGHLYYNGKGKYYVSSATATSDSSSDAAAVIIYTSGTDLGTGTSSSGSSSSGSSSSSSSSSGGGYSSASALSDGYAVFSIDGYAFGFKENSFQYTTVTPASDGTVTAVKGNYMQVTTSGDGYVFTVDDPPGTANYIYIDDTGALAHSTTAVSGYWTYSVRGSLAYNDGSGNKYYITGASADGLTISTDKGQAVKVTAYVGTTEPSMSGSSGSSGGSSSSTITVDTMGPQIVVEPETAGYVTEGSGYAAPVYSITVQLPTLEEGMTVNNVYFQWYVNGEKSGDPKKIAVKDADANRQMTSTFTADALAGQAAGVYPVYCETYWKITDSSGTATTYTNTSITTNFIVCKGVLENSFLTFSDVHETFENVGVAINDSITIYGGMIPALIICTGDWANSHYMTGEAGADNYNTTLNTYIARLLAQAGGIDTVFVSGNHDNGAAAANATVEADLGTDEAYDGLGVIYDSNEDESAGSSAANDGLIVFGINYDQLVVDSGYSYANVLPELEAFLEDLSQNYNGELVVISAHAGLHVLGLQEESDADSEWSGGNDYNIDKSDEMVSLLNKYAEQMDIMFFFGHDHSKAESEFVLESGDTIVSTTSYADKTYSKQTIKFTYGHAGYITNTIGGEKYYSLVTWDDETILRNMSVAGSGTQETVKIARVAEVETEPDPKPEEKPDEEKDSTVSSDKSAAPRTGDETNIALYVVLGIACMAGLAVTVTAGRKKHN